MWGKCPYVGVPLEKSCGIVGTTASRTWLVSHVPHMGSTHTGHSEDIGYDSKIRIGRPGIDAVIFKVPT